MEVYFMRYSGSGEELLPLLSEQRREKALGAKAPAVRRQTVAAYALLRLALYERYGIAAAPEFIYGEHGKPFLKDFPDVFFSLSHSADAVLCAVSDAPVGADLQEVRQLKGSVARKFCTAGELARLEEAPDRDRELCRLWCIKESYGKLTGEGFAAGFDRIDADGLLKSGRAFLTEREGFFIAACAEESFTPPEITEVSGSEISVSTVKLTENRDK